MEWHQARIVRPFNRLSNLKPREIHLANWEVEKEFTLNSTTNKPISLRLLAAITILFSFQSLPTFANASEKAIAEAIEDAAPGTQKNLEIAEACARTLNERFPYVSTLLAEFKVISEEEKSEFSGTPFMYIRNRILDKRCANELQFLKELPKPNQDNLSEILQSLSPGMFKSDIKAKMTIAMKCGHQVSTIFLKQSIQMLKIAKGLLVEEIKDSCAEFID